VASAVLVSVISAQLTMTSAESLLGVSLAGSLEAVAEAGLVIVPQLSFVVSPHTVTLASAPAARVPKSQWSSWASPSPVIEQPARSTCHTMPPLGSSSSSWTS
jgi:hypothetical protein